MTVSRLFYGFEAETVFDPQAPIEGESLLSWIARTALENALPHITTIMRDVGQVHRNRLADVMRKAIDVEGLATILGHDLSSVQSRRSQDVGDHRTRYLGSLLKTGDVHTRERRFAPAALANDPIPHYRASWLIRTFPVCIESCQVLRSGCDCGTVQTWATVSSMVFCEGCGEDLRTLAADMVPHELRPGLAFLADILFGAMASRAKAMAQLPAELQLLDPGDIYELALLMARIVDPAMSNPREHVWHHEPLRLARALATAGPLLVRWPQTPWLALEAAGDTGIMLPRCKPLKVLHRVLDGDYAPNIAPPVRSALDRIRLEVTTDGENARDDLVDVGEAARILHVNKPKVRATRAAGHLAARFLIRCGEILPAYDRDEVEAFAVTVGWPSAALVGKRIGLPPYGVEQLCAMDAVVWAKAPHRTLRPGLRIRPASVDALEAALRSSAGALASLADPVPLSTAMRGIGGRVKPWGPVLRGLLARKWPYVLGRQGCVVREICVDRTDVDAIRGMAFDAVDWEDFPFSHMINQLDACDILNVPNRSRHLIERFKIGERRGAWLFNRDAMLALAAEIITSAELQALLFLETKTTMAVMRRAGLTPHMFGFKRPGAIEAFDAARAA